MPYWWWAPDKLAKCKELGSKKKTPCPPKLNLDFEMCLNHLKVIVIGSRSSNMSGYGPAIWIGLELKPDRPVRDSASTIHFRFSIQFKIQCPLLISDSASTVNFRLSVQLEIHQPFRDSAFNNL